MHQESTLHNSCVCYVLLIILWARKKLHSRSLCPILLFQPSLLALILDTIKMECCYQHVRCFSTACVNMQASVPARLTMAGCFLSLFISLSLHLLIKKHCFRVSYDHWHLAWPNKNRSGSSVINTSPFFPSAHCEEDWPEQIWILRWPVWKSIATKINLQDDLEEERATEYHWMSILVTYKGLCLSQHDHCVNMLPAKGFSFTFLVERVDGQQSPLSYWQ